MKPYPRGTKIEFGNGDGDRALQMVRERWVHGAPIIETGTHHGYLSAKLATLLSMSFVTIEADAECYAHARKMLPTKVHCAYGCSVPLNDAYTFMRGDAYLTRPERFPDVYADASDESLAEVYWQELRGELFTSPAAVQERKRREKRQAEGSAETLEYPYGSEGEDLLRKYLRTVRTKSPLVVLDSAGGIGYFEFRIAREVMEDLPVAYLLDDVRHVKHIRSVSDLLADERFDVFVSGGAHAWALATSR